MVRLRSRSLYVLLPGYYVRHPQQPQRMNLPQQVNGSAGPVRKGQPQAGRTLCLTTSKSRCQPGLFSNEEAEAQRDEVTDPQSHSWVTEELADRVYLRFILPPPNPKRCPEIWCEGCCGLSTPSWVHPVRGIQSSRAASRAPAQRAGTHAGEPAERAPLGSSQACAGPRAGSWGRGATTR